MFQTKDVTEWTETFRAVDLPDLRLTFAGLFGHLLLLQFDFNTTSEAWAKVSFDIILLNLAVRIIGICLLIDTQKLSLSLLVTTVWTLWAST